MKQRGMTLLEVMIATVLFSAMMVVVIEAMITLRSLASTVDDMDVLEEQAASAKRAITRDLASSGWFYCISGVNGRKFYPQIHLSEVTWQPSSIAPPPEVTIPEFNPLTNVIASRTYTASVNLNQATILGDALVFARLQAEGQPFADVPSRPSAAIINFDSHAPQRLDLYARANPVQSLVIKPTATDQPDLTSVVWETTPTKIQSGLDSETLFDDRNIRLFSYRVIPDPVTGRRQLIRFYSNPTNSDRNTASAWIQDEVIANDVMSMRIYSYKMATWYSGTIESQNFTDNQAAGLTNNQIRFVVDFARNLSQADATKAIDLDDRSTTMSRDTHRASTGKRLEFTVGLRSITNSLDQ